MAVPRLGRLHVRNRADRNEADYGIGSTLFVDGGMKPYPGFEDNG
jgi:hypothetical protein